MTDAAADPRLTEQAVRKGEIEIKKLAAETRSAESASIVPTLPAEIPTGSLNPGENASPIGVSAAYRSLQPIAETIVDQIPASGGVWIVPDDVVSTYRAIHEMITSALDRAEKELQAAGALVASAEDRMMVEPATIALGFVTAAISPLASLLKRNTTIRSSDVAMTFNPVAAAIATELRRRDPDRTNQLAIDGLPMPVSSDLAERVVRVATARDDLAEALRIFRRERVVEPASGLAEATERLDAARAAVNACAAAAECDASNLEVLVDRLASAASDASVQRRIFAQDADAAAHVAAAVEGATEFLAAVQTASPAGPTPLQLASIYETNQDSYVLLVEPSFAGASSTYEEIPIKKDRAIHYGSAIVSFMLLDEGSNVVSSGIATGYAVANTTVGSSDVSWGEAATSD